MAGFRSALGAARDRWTAALGIATFALAFAGPPSQAWALPQRPAIHRDRPDAYTFAFQDAPIGQAAQEILGGALGLTYTVDPEVTGKISFRIDKTLTRAQLLEAFEAVLAANGVVLVRDGESLTLTPRAKAKQAAGLHVSVEGNVGGGYQVVAVALNFATPSEVAKALESMGRTDLVVYTDDKLGLILLGGTERELEAARQALKVLDQSGFQSSRIRWFELTQAPAATVADELKQVFEASNAGGVSVVALKRLNGILAFARTPEALDQLSAWIAKLDVPSKQEAPSLWVYRPLNLPADALANTLNSVLGTGENRASEPPAEAASKAAGATADAKPAAPAKIADPQPAAAVVSGEGAVRIGVSRESNTLIIVAPASRWLQIKQILDEVDRTPQQILIEASILEVTLTNDLEFGVDWKTVGANGKLNVANVSNTAGAVAPIFPGFSVTYLSNNLQAAVTALRSMTEVEVVSAPKLVALDNHTAKLSIGDQVPVTVQSAQSTTSANAPIISSTQYQDTGVILNVTPRIAGDDQIVLDIDQEVSTVAKTTSSGIDSPTIQQRRLQSTLILQDGEAAALGGLISDNRTRSNSGIPLISQIPLLGAAFRTTGRDHERTELIVLITAKIMKDTVSRGRVMHDLEADMHEIEAHGLLKH